MSNVLGEAVVPIRAKFDKFDEDLAGAKGKLKGALGALGGAVGGVAKAGLIGVGVAAAGATIAVGKFASDSAGAFISFQEQMNEVFTLLPGISKDVMSQMSQDVLEFSNYFGVLPEEVIPALYQAISAGVPADNVFEFLETAQKAARGGVTELETALDGITSVVNAYGADVLDAAEASDLMFTAVKLGKTTFEELSASLFNVVPSAAAVGIGFGDVTAALALMTSQGVPTSVATTQLRQLIVELGKDGSKAAKAFQEWTGQALPDFIAEGHDLTHVLAAMDGYSQATGISLQNLFGSVEAGNAALALSGDKWDAFSGNLEQMNNSAGATDAAFETMSGGLQTSIDKLNAFWATTKIGVGEALSPLIGTLAELANDALPWLEEMLFRARPIIAAFSEEFSSKLGPAAMVIMDAFNRIGQALGLTNEEFSGMDLLLALLKGSLDLIVTAVEALAVAMHLLANAVEWTSGKWRDFRNWLDGTEIPEDLTPGSPTPFEIGLRGIASAIDSMPDFAGKFEMGTPAFGGALGGGGGGISNTTIVNIDGVSAMSTGGDSVDEAIRLTVQLLRNQLGGRR